MIRAINEHAISLLNYYVGVINLEPGDYQKLDQEIRQILVKHNIHKQPASKERLYLPRDQMGRGLHSCEFRSEQMLWQLYNTLMRSKCPTLRREAILKAEERNCTHLLTIES
ncbi:hypothetical protein NGRA_0208, partial [Nosema granulosis]